MVIDCDALVVLIWFVFSVKILSFLSWLFLHDWGILVSTSVFDPSELILKRRTETVRFLFRLGDVTVEARRSSNFGTVITSCWVLRSSSSEFWIRISACYWSLLMLINSIFYYSYSILSFSSFYSAWSSCRLWARSWSLSLSFSCWVVRTLCTNALRIFLLSLSSDSIRDMVPISSTS